MVLQTKVDIAPSAWSLTYDDRVLLLGSCFSDNMARKLSEYYFCVSGNPFGTLYNPISISHHVTDDVMAKHNVVVITFGTSWVYIDKQHAQSEYDLTAVVDNCCKRPASDFIRYRLTVNDIVSVWTPIITRYPHHRFVFTVSPIRHVKDGLHENQISKAILLQSIDAMLSNQDANLAQRVSYFPSYEILLDELRDYRFYADDLMHPSSVAIEYIWERFADTYIHNASVRETMQELHQYWRDSQHRLLNPESEEAQLFIRRLAQRRDSLRERYPWI